jgi:hypothetical protein
MEPHLSSSLDSKNKNRLSPRGRSGFTHLPGLAPCESGMAFLLKRRRNTLRERLS